MRAQKTSRCCSRGDGFLQAELDLLAEAVRRIEGAARSVWPGCRAAPFGSQATGLALPGADLDVVVLGASSELQRAGSGFTKVSMPDIIRVHGQWPTRKLWRSVLRTSCAERAQPLHRIACCVRAVS
jgi:hypothetical protein